MRTSYIFLTVQQNETSDIPLPVMTIIAMLLLMLPYLIRRYTGRSLTEWLRLSVIIDGLEDLAAKIRGALFGGNGAGAKAGKNAKSTSGKNAAAKGADANRKSSAWKNATDELAKDKAARKAAEKQEAKKNREMEQERTRKKQRAGNVRNDYLHAVSRILDFTRKNKLFAIVPGNITHGGQTADLTAVIVTRCRVVGVMAYGFDGKIQCAADDGIWTVSDDEGSRAVGNLNAEARKQDRIVKAALKAGLSEELQYKTVMLFTSSNAVLEGKRPANAFTCDELFASLSSEGDLHTGTLDPKTTGKVIAGMREGKSGKNYSKRNK